MATKKDLPHFAAGLAPAEATKIEENVKESKISDLLDGVEWNAVALDAALYAIDAIQKFILPLLVKANATVGALLGYTLQSVEDGLRAKQGK